MPEPRFIESIRVVDAEAQLLDYHQERVECTLKEHSARPFFYLKDYVAECLEDYKGKLRGVYKLRFEYTLDSLHNLSLNPYIPRQVDRLYPHPIVSANCYRYKYKERRVLESYLQDERHQESSPHTLPVFTHRGLLTDTPYSNIVLDMGDGVWRTPAEPLLRGVMRQYLLDEGEIQTETLTEEDLLHAHRFRLINALLPLED